MVDLGFYASGSKLESEILFFKFSSSCVLVCEYPVFMKRWSSGWWAKMEPWCNFKPPLKLENTRNSMGGRFCPKSRIDQSERKSSLEADNIIVLYSWENKSEKYSFGAVFFNKNLYFQKMFDFKLQICRFAREADSLTFRK